MHSICFLIFFLVELAKGLSDLDALLDLKRGIQDNPSGNVLLSWDSKSMSSDGCPMNWNGIECVNGSVTSIILDGFNLSGEFNLSAISRLNMLQNLSISNNQFTGNVMEQQLDGSSIGSLQFVDLSCNQFHGSISSLSSLKNLMLLNLSLNNFQDPIPSDLGKLANLKYLDLKSNGFSSNVMSLLSQLGGLVYVDLSYNRFNGFLDLGLGNSTFISTIQYLNVSHNNLDGQLFSHNEVPYLDSLQVFDGSNNGFFGKVPPFNLVVSLQILLLGSNRLNGSLPLGLLQESSMVLSELDLSFNQLQGPIGNIITSPTLRKLNLSNNKLSGTLPIRVGHCAIIDLSNNLLSGSLSRIQGWGNYVEVINLSSNLLTGALPNQTSQFLRLLSLIVSNNSLSGIIPPILTQYPELQVIDLSHNRLNGPLLPIMFNSTVLIDINLSNNNFTGPLPFQPVDLSQNLTLVSLDLSFNELSGPLPREIGDFHSLAYLDISFNQLDGVIPDDLSSQLKSLNLSYNNFSGDVPENLLRFPDSSFHPGNSFLVLPSNSSSASLNSGKHKAFWKSAVRTAIIAGLVVGFSILIMLMVLLIYFRSRQKQYNNPGSKEILEEDSIQSPKSELQVATRSVEGLPPPSSSSMSFIESTNPDPSNGDDCTPDKLAGDLHLFDSSLSFSAEELSRAPAELIGRSCHGMLYKAVLSSDRILAVKWLKEGIAKGKKEFVREAKKLGNIHHPNLAPLRGYYYGPKDHENLIVSDFISAPCLALYLHETSPRQLRPISLQDRVKIAVDISRCLNYLHVERAIPHGNLKSTNVLIQTTSGPTAILTDYSLHRLLTPTGTAEQVLTAGALGYRPPEFANTSRPCPSVKSDVYAFGVILLELLTGRSSSEIVSAETGVVDLTEWVRYLAAESRSFECFDDSLSVDADRLYREMDRVLEVALSCILTASERPDMKTVFEHLSAIEIGGSSAAAAASPATTTE
ncbi:LRR receptor-like serine/threonine-protein kinase GHR1 [Impatiens glandulifera]|uniref:LRR receptor-like serine/threonine-protein kinase GHR1 n=1 Tax=Impatiens glandulifera TaxID=253017 RepID=UPI001FB19863|nr:LRR receptor-like serine/threonine-protein kinase GHR1 [Impatiens glandulifera]